MAKELDLRPMLKPESVAIIGASRDPEKVGHIILQNYVDAEYRGRLYAVNKNADEIMGFKSYKSVMEIKDRIDLAVIAIPAPFVPDALVECGKARVKTVVVVSGGFAETGNVDLQNKLTSISKKYNIAMVGPNCLGVMDPRSKNDTLFLPTKKLSKPEAGGVSFMSQSGAVGSTVLDLIAGEGFGLSKFISYGNAACVDEVDILNYLMRDDETKVIIMYIEGIKRPKEFIEVARKVTKIKPVVVLKAGRTQAGVSAAHSHTAALAGNYEAHEAVFRQFGFTIANDFSELLYYAKIFASEPEPKGNKVAIITNGGGTGVLTADAIGASEYLKLGELGKEASRQLKKVMPVTVNIRNPLDIVGDAGDKRYEEALASVVNDKNMDMVIVIVLFQTPGADDKVVDTVIKYKSAATKPLVVISAGSEYTEKRKKIMERAGLPVYDSPTAVAKAFSELLKYSRYKKKQVA